MRELPEVLKSFGPQISSTSMRIIHLYNVESKNMEIKNVERRCMRKEKERYCCSVTIKTFYLTVRNITTIFSRASFS